MTLQELQQKRNALATEMRQLHDEIGDKVWTDEQRQKWEGMTQSLENLEAKIKREQELRQLDQQFVQTEQPPQSQAENPELNQRSVFQAYLRNGVTDFSPAQHQILKEMRAMGVGANEKGGYTVPKEMQAQIIEQMKAYGGISSVSQILTTSDGRILEWVTADGTAEEGELLGENQATSEGDTLFGTIALDAKKLSSKVIRVSNELLLDNAVDIENYLTRRIAERIGRAEAKYLIQGTGVGTPLQPKGLATSVTGTTTATAAGKVDWKDLNALLHSLDPAYRNASNTRLAFNDNTFRQLKEMEDSQKRPLWLPDIVGVAPATILGHQFVIDQGIADIGTGNKFMFFGDFNRFVIRRVAQMNLMRLVERYAEYDQVGFLAFHRFDCLLEDTSAIKALVGK